VAPDPLLVRLRRAPGLASLITLLGLGLGLGPLTACSELPEVAYETERFEIAPDFDYPICAGTLEYLDGHLGWVEDAVNHELPRDERVRFYWITEDIGQWCRGDAQGCYFPGTRVIFASGASVTHEMVHAVLDAEAQTNLFFEEGLAEHYSGVGVRYRGRRSGEFDLAETVWLSARGYRRGELDYALAAHFIAFVEAEFGHGAVQRITNAVVAGVGPEELERELEKHTHMSFEQLGELYAERARKRYAGLRDRDVPELAWSYSVDVSLRCDDASTFGPLPDGSPGMYRTLRVELSEPRVVDLDLWGPDTLRLELIDLAREREAGPVLDVFHPQPGGAVEHPRMVGGDQARWELRAGTHLLLISQHGYELAEASLVATLVGRAAATEPAPQ
jgi:hypothetical protein